MSRPVTRREFSTQAVKAALLASLFGLPIVSLSGRAGSGGGGAEDHKLLVRASDTTPDFLFPKLAPTGEFVVFIANPNGNEVFQLSANFAGTVQPVGIANSLGSQLAIPHTDHVHQAKIIIDSSDTTADFLSPKLSAGKNITLSIVNPGGNENLRIDSPRTISIEGSIVDGIVGNYIIWRAPFACTITKVWGYQSTGLGGLNANQVVNVQKNGSLKILVTDLTLPSGTLDSWIDGGAVQNNSLATGDKLEIMLITLVGSPALLAVQVDATVP